MFNSMSEKRHITSTEMNSAMHKTFKSFKMKFDENHCAVSWFATIVGFSCSICVYLFFTLSFITKIAFFLRSP